MNTTRRDLLRQAAAAGIALPLILSRQAGAMPPGERLNLGFIGTGGMGGGQLRVMEGLGENIVALCDVDSRNLAEPAQRNPSAATYSDYRKMLEEQHGNLDAVMIGTPDHHHYPATVIAMQLGLHVYTQKPLTHTVWEARRLTQLAAENPKLVTQMGNQGHAGEGWRQVCEWIHSGKVGDITEVHTWTNRPIWPQGIPRPNEGDEVPPELDWDLWRGPTVEERAYKNDTYHPFKWRGWWDYGTGALGDMACHTMDGMFWALDPVAPASVEPVAITRFNAETYPESSVLRWNYAARGDRPAFTATWYDGGLRPGQPAELGEKPMLPPTGNLFIGTKAIMLVPGDYGGGVSVHPRDGKVIEPPEPTMPRSEGHYQEWVAACKGEGKTMSHFGYAGPMTQAILLGNVAMRAQQRIEWDDEAGQVTNLPGANEWITKEYREGWRF